ncbi:hypothetical protein WG915_08890 [Corynebacterium sp. H128]|uniref:hypothetical protein n=1 Tax=Corynebacterium sp. H128 TaxID=3133427 RepID=UPI003094EB7E
MRQLAQPDPRGVLALIELTKDIRDAELATQAADKLRPANCTMWSEQHQRNLPAHRRQATPTELHLLEQLGYDTTGIETTYMWWITPGVRFRWWAEIDKQNKEKQQ